MTGKPYTRAGWSEQSTRDDGELEIAANARHSPRNASAITYTFHVKDSRDRRVP